MVNTVPLRLKIPINDSGYVEFISALKRKRFLSPLLTTLIKGYLTDVQIQDFVSMQLTDKGLALEDLPSHYRKIDAAISISVQFKLTNERTIDEFIMIYQEKNVLMPFLSTLLNILYTSISFTKLLPSYMHGNVTAVVYSDIEYVLKQRAENDEKEGVTTVEAIDSSIVSTLEEKVRLLEEQNLKATQELLIVKALNERLEKELVDSRTQQNLIMQSMLMRQTQQPSSVATQPSQTVLQQDYNQQQAVSQVQNTQTIPTNQTTMQQPVPVATVQPVAQTHMHQINQQPVQQSEQLDNPPQQPQEQPKPKIDAMAAFRKTKNSVKNI